MKNLTVLSLLFGLNTFVFGQDKPVDVKYRRSSLHIILAETGSFPNKDNVLKAFNNAPFPDKYNDQNIGDKSFNPANYPLTAEEKATVYKSSKMGHLMASSGAMKVDSMSKELPLRIQKYLDKEKIGNKLVAKWFNRQADGSMDWLTIADRGVFNASFLESKTALSSSDGKSLLQTAGYDLIPNTFVIIDKFNFVANEPVARAIRDAAEVEAAKISIPFAKEKAMKTLEAVYQKTKEGYSVWATSYLYKLVWDKSIQSTFDTEMYFEKSNIDPKKKAAFDNSNIFKLEFIGDESATGFVMFSLKEKRTEERIIEIATNRTIDHVYTKLQKNYDVFKTKTPLFTGIPITAKIGKKEGLEGGDKFEVLEQNIDPKTGVATYKNVGTIKVEDDMIWDNLYDAESDAADAKKPALDRTTFSGGKKYYPGMLVKQIK